MLQYVLYTIYMLSTAFKVLECWNEGLFPITVTEEIKVSIIGWTSSYQQCLVTVLLGCRKSPVLLE